MKRLLAEFLGTFVLVFAGTGSMVVNETGTGAIGTVGTALVFGLAVLTMIYAFGDVSGAHLNPAVTLGFAVARRFPWRDTGPYIAAQLAGAFTASGLLKGLFPASLTLGAALPAGSPSRSFVLEIILTAVLMLTILSVTAGAKEKRSAAPVAIGSVVALAAMFAGPVSGASMNPARSLAPAILSGQMQHLWLYPAAAVLGALMAVPLCAGTRESGCCGRPC